MRKKVIIDTDPSADDAIALMLAMASPELEILGMTAASGVCEASRSLCNIMRIQELWGCTGIPAVKGAEMPLLRSLCCDDAYCGADGLSETDLPLPVKKAYPGTAADFIVQMAHCFPGEITLISLAPMTNVALALKAEPSLPKFIREIITIDGNYALWRYGKEMQESKRISLNQHSRNREAVSQAKEGFSVCADGASLVMLPPARMERPEWNILQDPEAAEMVFASGIPIRAAGLDVTACFGNWMIDQLLKNDGKSNHQNGPEQEAEQEAQLCSASQKKSAARLFLQKAVSFNLRRGLEPYSLLVDSAAIALAIDPQLCEMMEGHASVCTKGKETGNICFANGKEGTGSPVFAAQTFDFARFLRLLKERIFV